MSKIAVIPIGQDATREVVLKDPVVAAVLAWLIPGAGHLYQGRTAKGMLYMICILSTFLFGLYLSEGRAVYAAWEQGERFPHLPYLCQVGVGLPALPALLQAYLVKHDKAPLAGGIMAPPSPPAELNDWYKRMNRYFELGTLYTVIAGLLNILVIYDAWGGPSHFGEPEEKKTP